MENIIDITGHKFNRLTAVRFIKRVKIKNAKGFHHIWEFRCDCGNIHYARKNAVKCGQTKSCGCLNKENVRRAATTHGLSKTRFYRIWKNMNLRCYNPSNKKYNIYGGRGIKCLWTSFEQFRDDMYSSYKEHCQQFGEKNTTLDRINSDGNYCIENCRWITPLEQSHNMRNNRFFTYRGKTLCLNQWSKKLKIPQQCLSYRLKKYNNDFELAVKNPIKYLHN